ncbi:hypothetical protein EW145_g1532 [Phellinidium pouzarii]|uniref:Uncharacterized protein n=1 Tax=Phellinidium pouzarii TaxID=167371 RepID=A0A4S4LEP5_9AGAM|nr:hypothetical protein EW145_g1532 [Phellinidium pouzarii]
MIYSEPVASSSSGSHAAVPPEDASKVAQVASPKKNNLSTQKQRHITPDKVEIKPRQSNRVDTYLASLRSEGIEPGLEDLQRLRPKVPMSPRSPKYASAYLTLVDRICRAFSKNQLQKFGEELGLEEVWTRPGRRKVEYAESIIEMDWGWDNLKELERYKRDISEVTLKNFPISSSELFLLLGKDGSQLLQISTDYNVHIAVNSRPLSIKIEGFRGSLKKLEALIVDRRKAIIEEIVELPTKSPLSPNLLQQVSRMSDAYIENVGLRGKVRICAIDPGRLEGAKRLILRAALNINHTSNTPLCAYLPPEEAFLSHEIFPITYALFPFLPERALPWTNTPGRTFRSRKVGEWIGSNSRDQDLSPSDILSDEGQLLDETGASFNLKDMISNIFPVPSRSRIITATTGQVLVTAKDGQELQSLLPPFPGHWQYVEFMKWMQKDGAHRMFVPSLPAPLHNSPPSREQIIHRLSYRQVSSKQSHESGGKLSSEKVIIFEVVITEQISPSRFPGTEQETRSTYTGIQDLTESFMENSDTLITEKRSTIVHPDVMNIGFDAPMTDTTTGEVGNDSSRETAVDEVSLNVGKSVADAADAFLAGESPSDDAVSEEMVTDIPIETVEESAEESLETGTSFDDMSNHAADSSTDDRHRMARWEESPEDINDEDLIVRVPTKHVEVHGEPTCYKGDELEMLVALPNRPMDVKMTVLDSVTYPRVDEIPELQNYFAALRQYLNNPAAKNPTPPLFIENCGDKFILESNASIRRSIESLDVTPRIAKDFDPLLKQESAKQTISTVTESIFDLETGHKQVNCEISCNPTSADAWTTFLQDLDGLTLLNYNAALKKYTRFSVDNQSSTNDVI